MKESFKGLCNLNEDELKDLLANPKTSIVIDTEVLLMLFQMEGISPLQRKVLTH